MSRPNKPLLAGFLLALLVLVSGVSFAKGGLYVGFHEGDLLHLVQIVLREARGQFPHLDFQTPIGVLATAPIALFVWLGAELGHAILYAQALVALMMLPAIWWVAASRFRGGLAYLYGGFILVLVLALVSGGTENSVSISMYYNRWAWALAYLAVAVTMLQGEKTRLTATVDGLVIGLALAAMALIKVTYFVGFLLPIAVALIGWRQWRVMVTAIVAGLVVAVLVTLWAGTPLFWLAYLHDLAVVSSSEVRPQPGLPFFETIASPIYLGGSLALLMGVIFLRQAGRRHEGLVLLLLVPGFFFVTYQNYGNDPQWLGLFALFMINLRPDTEMRNGFGWDLRQGMGILAVLGFAFALPSVLNLTFSPFRHLATKTEKYMPLVPDVDVAADLMAGTERMRRVDGKVAFDGPGQPFAAYADEDLREESITVWQGETWPDCTGDNGMAVRFQATADDLNASGLIEGKRIFSADILASYWLYGASEPLPHGAPWYYAGLPGFESADYLLVPLCPFSLKARKLVLEAVEDTGVALTEVRRNEIYVLYAK